jgi:mannose-6-phosphate isomerase-like protein (cupin superfamily)
MGDPTYSYATHLNIKFDPLKLIDVSSLAKDVTDKWYNQTLCKVNDSVVRLGVMQGEYHWHKHDNDDEFFFVLSGKFIIDLEGRSVELLPNQGFVVPKGVMHCTRAPEKGHQLSAAEPQQNQGSPTWISAERNRPLSPLSSRR